MATDDTIAIFDLDGTITRRDTYAAYLLGYLRRHPLLWRRLRSDRNLRLFLPAHFFWEYSLAAIRTFVMLYLLKGLGFTTGELLPLLVVIILVYLLASVISGPVPSPGMSVTAYGMKILHDRRVYLHSDELLTFFLIIAQR